jgi:hypothetical protein
MIVDRFSMDLVMLQVEVKDLSGPGPLVPSCVELPFISRIHMYHITPPARGRKVWPVVMMIDARCESFFFRSKRTVGNCGSLDFTKLPKTCFCTDFLSQKASPRTLCAKCESSCGVPFIFWLSIYDSCLVFQKKDTGASYYITNKEQFEHQ